MTTAIVPADWIRRIVDDEKQRDAARDRAEEIATRKSDLVRLNGRRLVDDLRVAVARDVEAFRSEFVGDASRALEMESTEATGGFVVRKPAGPEVTLTVAPHFDTAAMVCAYQFTSTRGLPPREERLELVFASDGAGTLAIKTQGSGQVFTTADALSEYLLGPIFTGRPR